ncbi:hypothetical protein OG474_41960 [Kribbella sp. NBC_01505]|uniref:hypothetical protein n=1 Tax=Kribbella sp. NBC_01505 TaxID=2903580 RepID=UPI00386BCC8C
MSSGRGMRVLVRLRRPRTRRTSTSSNTPSSGIGSTDSECELMISIVYERLAPLLEPGRTIRR